MGCKKPWEIIGKNIGISYLTRSSKYPRFLLGIWSLAHSKTNEQPPSKDIRQLTSFNGAAFQSLVF
eukprot:4142298-Amphidinium_carterae.1